MRIKIKKQHNLQIESMAFAELLQSLDIYDSICRGEGVSSQELFTPIQYLNQERVLQIYFPSQRNTGILNWMATYLLQISGQVVIFIFGGDVINPIVNMNISGKLRLTES